MPRGKHGFRGGALRFYCADKNALIFKERKKSSYTNDLNQKVKSSGKEYVPCVLGELENMGSLNTVSVNFTGPSDDDHLDVLKDDNKELFHRCAKDTGFNVDNKMDNYRGLKKLFTTNQANKASKNVLEFWNQTQHLQKIQTTFNKFYEDIEKIIKDYVANSTDKNCLVLFDKNDEPTQFLIDIKLKFRECFKEIIPDKKELEDGFDKIIKYKDILGHSVKVIEKEIEGKKVITKVITTETEEVISNYFLGFHKFKEDKEFEKMEIISRQ